MTLETREPEIAPISRRSSWSTASVAQSSAVPAAVLAALIIAIAAKDPSFISTRSIAGLMLDAAPLLLLALGSTFVILIGGIDLSGAALASLASVLLAEWLTTYGWFGLGLVLLVGILAGAIQGMIQGVGQTPSFVVTLGGLGIFSGLALRISGERTQPLGDGASVVDWINDSTFWFVPNAFGLGVLMLVALSALMRYTTVGRDVRVTGLAEAAAIMSGVRPVRVRVIVFALAGLCAAMGGTVMTARTAFGSPTLSTGLLLPTIAAVVAGGTAISGGVGSLLRTLLGALIIASIRTGSVIWDIEPVYQDVAFGAVIILAVAATTDRRKLDIIK